MAIIKCKMCGGDMVISDDKTYGTCEYCGSQMTLPKISDDQRAAAFNRGNHFRRIGEFDKALQVYERIVREDENDAEAHWCCALCRFGIEYVEDPASFEYIPTCHRASFDNFLEDVDFLAAVEHSDGITRRQYQKDGAKIAEVQRGILATSQNEDPYDVFICYKETDENGNRTRDSAMAQDIYYQLTEQGRRVFFARITLEDKVGAEYEPYIFAALHSAKVMVVVGTSAENLNAVWVKNEWSRFLAMMKYDRNKILLPCYRDMDPYDMPDQLGVLQSYDMSKIGFIQDLTRGISKVLDADKQSEVVNQTVKETVVVQQAGGGNADALLKRGYMSLEDGAWEQADSFFEEVLNLNAECAGAYLGKVLAEEKVSNLEKLAVLRLQHTECVEPVKMTIPENTATINSSIKRYTIPGYLSTGEILSQYKTDMTYYSYVKTRRAQCVKEKNYWNTHRNMNRAIKFSDSKLSEEIENFFAVIYKEMDQRIQKAVQDEITSRQYREKRYAAFIDKTENKLKQCIFDKVVQTLNYTILRQEFDKGLEILEKIEDFSDVRTKMEFYRKYEEYILKKSDELWNKFTFIHQNYQNLSKQINVVQDKIDEFIKKKHNSERSLRKFDKRSAEFVQCQDKDIKFQKDIDSLNLELENLSIFSFAKKREISKEIKEIKCQKQINQENQIRLRELLKKSGDESSITSIIETCENDINEHQKELEQLNTKLTTVQSSLNAVIRDFLNRQICAVFINDREKLKLLSEFDTIVQFIAQDKELKNLMNPSTVSDLSSKLKKLWFKKTARDVEAIYYQACQSMENPNSIDDIIWARGQFLMLSNYKDVAIRISRCDELIGNNPNMGEEDI